MVPVNFKAKIADELHRPARKRFPTRKTELKNRHDLYQADLIEMGKFSRINKGFKYILMMINCFTKVAIAVPVKDKTAKSVANVLGPILKKHRMRHLQTDDGKEFFNAEVRKLLKQHNINHYSTYTDKKSAIVERLNRTIKNKMYREFTAQGSYRWLEILPKIIREYNNSFHSSIGMPPNKVTAKNEKLVLTRLNSRVNVKSVSVKPKFKIGQRVRISKYKAVFDKKYLPNWTNEVFVIAKIQPTIPPTYILKDHEGKEVLGGFYEQEMAKTNYDNVYLVEKVLKRKKNLLYVKWKGFDASHNSWIQKKDLV